ncbi:hypothetical protein CAEBREN_07905 [Caenorhabditis brenneri]|uniref:Uncharacterized protein n=1 Tax=Caenorhabditis brenneri TaxID=135651 RepID=G0P0K8_CAEBE|nr:hypothetical protein CAEBREN_07905 [Caenorhabditis brenneri]
MTSRSQSESFDSDSDGLNSADEEYFECLEKKHEVWKERYKKIQQSFQKGDDIRSLSKMIKEKKKSFKEKKRAFVKRQEGKEEEIAEERDDVKLMREIRKVKKLEKNDLDKEAETLPRREKISEESRKKELELKQQKAEDNHFLLPAEEVKSKELENFERTKEKLRNSSIFLRNKID